MLAADGFELDDGTMCRYAEDAGATLGCIVERDAPRRPWRTAFCLSTDATGVRIQPEPLAGRQRQAVPQGPLLRRARRHDHVFFEFQPKHTSAAVCAMFRGFPGYIQADAHAIYDALFRGDARASPNDEAPTGGGLLGPLRDGILGSCGLATHERGARGAAAHAHALRARGRSGRTSRRSSDTTSGSSSRAAPRRLLRLGRASSTRASRAPAASSPPPSATPIRQETALRRFLDDGRLRMTNNHSERALRGIAFGRKAWLFFGSDDHASAAANLFSLIASLRAPPPRPRDLPRRDHPRPAVLAARALPRARPQVLGHYARASRRRGTRARSRRADGPADRAAGCARVSRPRA